MALPDSSGDKSPPGTNGSMPVSFGLRASSFESLENRFVLFREAPPPMGGLLGLFDISILLFEEKVQLFSLSEKEQHTTMYHYVM